MATRKAAVVLLNHSAVPHAKNALILWVDDVGLASAVFQIDHLLLELGDLRTSDCTTVLLSLLLARGAVRTSGASLVDVFTLIGVNLTFHRAASIVTTRVRCTARFVLCGPKFSHLCRNTSIPLVA